MRTPLFALAALALAGCQAGGPLPPAASTAAAEDGCRAGEARLACDRRAILAMAGEYAVSFAFDEVTALRPGYALKAPKRSGAREWVQLIEDRGDFLSLQHILVAEDGTVTKHWRQDWQYEPAALLDFQGQRSWRRAAVTAEDARGAWSQSVYEVDDSPRYAGLGRWRHDGNVAAWTSAPSRRPLPRREYTTRSDYDVLVAVNRQEIAPDGWVHSQDNLKLDTKAPADTRYIARELGANRYQRLAGYDFGPGRRYWEQTQDFWAAVRSAWAARIAGAETVRLKDQLDGKTLWQHMFAAAEARLPAAERDRRIAELLDRYLGVAPAGVLAGD